MKLRGVPIVYRLDGISWIHRKSKFIFKQFVTAEFRNFICKVIHGFLADKIIYQSIFVQKWWTNSGYRVRKDFEIIYNAVYVPSEITLNKDIKINLTVIENTIDYTPYSVKLLNELAAKLDNEVDILLFGHFSNILNENKLSPVIKYNGFIKREEVFNVLPGSIYLSLDINPACPNTVIEALSCGAPVIAFDTGSLRELVPSDAGKIISYGSCPWSLLYPDVDSLFQAIIEVKNSYSFYSTNAHRTAFEKFRMDIMMNNYLSVLYKVVSLYKAKKIE